MKIWFDTEFYENGKTIELISIGMVREDGATYYCEGPGSRHTASKTTWLRLNVLPHLIGPNKVREVMAKEIVEFAGEKPEFWADYAGYDWVALCQLHGTMMDLPKGWPMFCMDVKQLCVMKGNPQLPKQVGAEHHALADAQWCKEAWEFLQNV